MSNETVKAFDELRRVLASQLRIAPDELVMTICRPRNPDNYAVDFDENEEWLGACGRGRNYDGCTLVGTEYCEFECPFRD